MVVLCHGFITVLVWLSCVMGLALFQCGCLVSWVYHCFSVVVLYHGFSIILVCLSCVMGLSLFWCGCLVSWV